MAVLNDLPSELLVQVFQGLGSIDDVHHLARACKVTNRIIQKDHTYVEVMRSVILQAPQHQYDIQLCRMLALHNRVVDHFQSGGTAIQPTVIGPHSHANTNVNQVEHYLAYAVTEDSYLDDDASIRKVLSNEIVFDILARWQGLRVYEDLWLARELAEADYLRVNQDFDAESFADAYTALQECDENNKDCPSDTVVRLTKVGKWYTKFNSDQTGRLYAAITGVWLMNEIRWVLVQFEYPRVNFGVPLTVLEMCKSTLKKQAENPVLDHLDQYSVYTFLYHHLLPLHSQALADQNSAVLPLTFSSNLDEDPVYSAPFLQVFLMAGQTYLQPPDIIDLVVRNKPMQATPFTQLHLPDSTLQHIHPHLPVQFPPNCSLTTLGWHPSLTGPCLRTLRAIQTATFTQSAQHPAAHNPIHIRGLYTLDDLLDSWFKDRIQVYFDLDARRDRREISEVFDRHWKKHVRWHIWWWANSEDKARMKMERWRRV